MKIGDLVQWVGSNAFPEKNGKVGLIIGKKPTFLKSYGATVKLTAILKDR